MQQKKFIKLNVKTDYFLEYESVKGNFIKYKCYLAIKII